MHTILLATVTVLLAVAPGLIVGYIARLPWHLALGFAVPLTYGMVALGAYVTGVLTVPWNLGSAAGTLLIFSALAALYRWLLARYSTPAEQNPEAQPSRLPSWPWLAAPAAGVLVGAGTILYILVDNLRKTPGGLGNVPSGWDSQWHTNVMTFIDDTGIASAVQMGRLMNVETHGSFYYPDGWHALNALLIPLTGSTPVQVLNISSIVTVALVVPLSVGALAWRIVRDRLDPAPAALAAGVAAGISGMFPELPYAEVGVGAVPFSISVGMAALVAVLVISVPGARMRIPLAALGLIGLASIHPAGALVAVAMVGFWWLLHGLLRPRRARVSDLLSLASVGLVTGVVLLPQISGVFSGMEEIESYNFTKPISRPEALWQSMTQQAWVLDSLQFRWFLLTLTLVGAVVLLCLRSWWWLAMWAALVLLATNAAVPFGQPWADMLFRFSSTFYNDARRLGYVQAILMIAVAGAGLGVLLWAAFTAVRKLENVPAKAGVGGLVAALIVIFGGAIWHTPAMSEELTEIFNHDRDDRMISMGDRAAFNFLAEQPDARTTTIFNDLDQGTGWAYALNGLHMLFNHYAWPSHVGVNQWNLWDKLKYTGDAAEPEKSAAVEASLKALDVKYIVMSGPVYWDFQTVPPGLRDLDLAPGLTKIFDNGDAQIYQVNGWMPPAPGEVTVGWGPHDDRSETAGFAPPPPAPAPAP